MYIYLITIIGSLLCLYLSEHIVQKFWKKFFLALSIVVPAALAGIRGPSVGTDTFAYKVVYFEPMKEISSLKNFFLYIRAQSLEVGFMGWCYIISKIFGSFQVFLFLTEAAILAFIYKAIYAAKDKTGLYFPLVIFYLLYYNNSFNIMRQMLACSISLYALIELIVNKKKQYVAFLLLSPIVHYSSLICIFIYLLYTIINSNYYRYNFKIFILFLIFFIYMNLKRVNILLQRIKILPTRYIGFFNNHISDDIFNTSFILFKALPIFVTLMCALILLKKKEILFDKTFQIGELLMGVSFFSYFFYSGSAIERLLIYIEMFSTIIMLPLCIRKSFKCNGAFVMKVSIISVFSTYWYWYYAFMGYAETIPYRSFY